MLMQGSYEHNIHWGIYRVQSGHRNDIAIIDCPYITHKVEVYDAHGLNILDGASVLWTEVRRHHLPRKKGNREVVCAVVVGIQHCQYITASKSILFTVRAIEDKGKFRVEGVPINSKLPCFKVVGSEWLTKVDWRDSSQRETYTQRYYSGRILSWNYL